MSNTLMVIEPYWYIYTWVLDDKSAGLDKEPFVQGIPEMIDILVKGIPNAHSGFRLLFSEAPFPDYQLAFTRVKEEYGGYWYRLKDTSAEGWLCPALFKYFEAAPETIYVKAAASPREVNIDSIDVKAIKETKEKLEQLVGKLTLENELLRKGHQPLLLSKSALRVIQRINLTFFWYLWISWIFRPDLIPIKYIYDSRATTILI